MIAGGHYGDCLAGVIAKLNALPQAGEPSFADELISFALQHWQDPVYFIRNKARDIFCLLLETLRQILPYDTFRYFTARLFVQLLSAPAASLVISSALIAASQL